MNSKYTAGPCSQGQLVDADTVCSVDDGNPVADCGFLFRSVDERNANAALIAEAFNVAHETGLTPRQLAEQRAELLAICHELATALAQDTGIPLEQCVGGPFKNYRRFIAKAEAK